ncbi:hypothetical protein RABR111495_11710 [Rahnella bruchi]|uniref:hypothetical protein n=1 Tax=Rahnella bruchi TaxID=1510573 RepID=UPI000EA2725C|nr:hypothetical protein [Rahnella bruchi]
MLNCDPGSVAHFGASNLPDSRSFPYKKARIGPGRKNVSIYPELFNADVIDRVAVVSEGDIQFATQPLFHAGIRDHAILSYFLIGKNGIFVHAIDKYQYFFNMHFKYMFMWECMI